MMDLLLSVPVVSYFVAPALTSWSTSLNLLFFYMTWSTLVLSHSPLRIELFGTLFIRLAFWLVPSLLFLLFDTLLPSLAESVKYGGAVALPPRNAKFLGSILGLAIFNLVLETALEAGISFGLANLLGTPVFRTSTALPFPWQIFKQLALLYIVREVLAYHIHRTILHSHRKNSSGKGSKAVQVRAQATANEGINWLAQKHARWAHARRAPPFSLMVATDHPVPFILHRLVPVLGAALVVRPHLLVYFLFVGLVTLEETLGMSGYSIIPGIILGGITRRTATHYANGGGPGSGNYGSFGLLDWAYGTSLGGSVMEDLREEADKHQLQERGEEKAGEAVGLISGGIASLRGGKKNKRVKHVAAE